MKISKIKNKISKGKIELFFLVVILIAHLFLRFYQFEQRNPFGWDQVDNAWAAKNIIIDHKFPLLGMQAKLNSGIYVGPFYYYLVSIFYFFSNLDPIASGILAGVTTIFSFFTLFHLAKKMFSQNIALMAVFINAFSSFGISFDRIQWPVAFIPALSLIIFFSLYKILTGFSKYILALAIALGLAFNIHFTAVFFLPIILLSLPFFPRTKGTLRYILIGLPLFFLWLVPIFIFLFQNYHGNFGAFHYGQTYYHGLHLKRIMQLAGDSFIQIEKFLTFRVLYPLKFIIIPFFVFSYLHKSVSREKLIFVYLVVLWFLVPWVVLSTYSGEISDYYFAINSFVGLLAISYLLVRVFEFRKGILIVPVSLLLVLFSFFNIQNFFTLHQANLYEKRQKVEKAVRERRKIEFTEGVPESYLYYIYTRNKK